MIFISLLFSWFLLSIFFIVSIGISLMLECDYNKSIFKVKIFLIGIVVIFIVSVILMILSLFTV